MEGHNALDMIYIESSIIRYIETFHTISQHHSTCRGANKGVSHEVTKTEQPQL